MRPKSKTRRIAAIVVASMLSACSGNALQGGINRTSSALDIFRSVQAVGAVLSWATEAAGATDGSGDTGTRATTGDESPPAPSVVE